MNIISYRYTNSMKQIFLASCFLNFLLSFIMIIQIEVFNVPGYEVNTLFATLFYTLILIANVMILLGYKFCYTLYDVETVIYFNKLLRRERSIELSDVNKIVLGKKGVNFYTPENPDESSLYIPFFRGGVIRAIEIDQFYRTMKEREGITVIKEFTVLPGYGKLWTALKVAYLFLAGFMFMSCATPLAVVIVLFQSFM